MITIKDTLGNVRFSTEINTGSRRKFSLMSEDYIVLKFSVEDPVYFKLGDYTDTELGLFELVDLYKPTLNDSTGAYDYELRLDAHYYKWKNKIFKFNPEVGGSEAGWKLTATLDVHLGVFLRNLSALGYTYKGTPFEVNIDLTVAKTSKLIVYDNTNLIDALTQMAETWECEWWVEDNQIRFGRCEFGDPVDFVINENVERMPREESKATFATRVYAFGSTRNIPNDYRPVDESVVVNGIVQKRLMMPTGVPYVDAYPDMTTEEAVEDVVIFDYIYPRRTGTMSSVTPVERPENVENEDGSTTQQKYIVYQFKDTGITFSKDYILPGEELRIVFQTGAMAGMDFAVTFNPDNLPEKLEDGSWNPQAQLWEIVRNEDYGRMLPADTLIPANGDTYNLYGFDSTSPVFEDMIKRAEEELEEKAKEYVEKTKIDPNTYPCTMMSDYMYNDGNVRTNEFTVGARINLINPAYFENGRVSRVIGFEFDLDIPYSSPIFTIGETSSYSRISDLEQKVEELTYKGQIYTGTGAGVYVIGTNDNTSPTNKNVYSALKVLREFVRYQGWIDQPLRTFDPVKFNSVTSNEDNWHITDKGDAKFRDVIGKVITITDRLMTDNFVAGMTGTGVGVVNKAEVHMDKGVIRKYLEVLALVVAQIFYRGGRQVLSPAGMKINKVEEFDGYWRCYMETEDGQVNQFTVGAQARCNRYGSQQRYWWRLVDSIGVDYIDVSKTDMDAGSMAPAVGDEVVQFGHRTDPYLQWVVMDSSFSDDAGRTIYAGVNSYDLSGKWVLREGVSPTDPSRIGLFTRHGEFSDVIDGINEDIEDNKQSIQEAKDTADAIQSVVDNLTGIIIPDMQNQLDGAIQSWDGEVEPTLNNYPANEWFDEETGRDERAKHVGDTYIYYTTDSEGNTVSSRYNFRFVDGVYKWELIADSVSAELEVKLRELTGTVGKKNSITYSNNVPTPVYNIDDLWIKEDGSMYICRAQKMEGMQGSAADWELFNDTMLRLVQIASDNVISVEEKPSLRDTWSQIQKEFTKYQADATTYEVSITNLQNAYNALGSFLTDTVKLAQDVDTSLTVSQKADYNQKFADYYSRRTEFSNIVSQKIADKSVGNLQIGMVNLLKGSNVELNRQQYSLGTYFYDTIPEVGKTYTIVMCYTLGENNTHINVFQDYGSNYAANFNTRGNRVIESKSFKFTIENTIYMGFVQFPNGTYGSKVHWAVLVEGNKGPNSWIPSQADNDAKAQAIAKAEAELAETKANAYADGIVTEAEQNAINEAQARLDALKIGSVNLVSRKMMLAWNNKKDGIAVWGQDSDGIYLGINQGALYMYVCGGTARNDLFGGTIKYKDNTQYVFQVKWKLAGEQTNNNSGVSFWALYTDGTSDGIRLGSLQTSLIVESLITKKGKTVEKIFSSYGDNVYRSLIYSLALYEGNKVLTEIPVATEDLQGQSNVNLVDGGKEVTVVSNSYSTLKVPVLKPNTVYTVRFTNVEVISGDTPSGYEFRLYDTGISANYATVEIKAGDNHGILITSNNFTVSIEGRLLFYPGIQSEGVIRSVKYTEIMLVEGFTPPSSYSPSPGDVAKDIKDVSDAVSNLDTTINTTFKDGIISEAEAKAIASNINVLNAEKADIDAYYTKLYANTYLTGTAKTNLASAKTAYDTAHDKLIDSINTAIADGKATATEKADVDDKFTAYNNALSAYQTRVGEADKAIQDTIKKVADDAQTSANTAQSAANAAQSTANQAQADANAANSKLTTWASDNYISPQEKTALRQQKSDIQAEYNDIVTNANRYNISSTSYSTAYNSAISALNKYTATSPENIQVIQSEYDNIAAYYTARQTILNSIAAAAKAQADKATWAIGMDGGKMLYADPEFKKGYNGVSTYGAQNNGGTVNLYRISKSTGQDASNSFTSAVAAHVKEEAAGSPHNGSDWCLYIRAYGGTTTSHLGGFYFGNRSRANAVFIVKVSAKIPVGYTLKNAHNSHGTDYKQEFLTPMVGTGKYETYIFKETCGSTGTFSTMNHLCLSGPVKPESDPLEWFVDYATVFDMTADGYGDIESVTKDDFASQLGFADFDALVANAITKGPLIKAGYINADLIETDKLVVNDAFVNKIVSNQAFISKLDGYEFNFKKGTAGGFKMESTILYSGAKFGTGGAGIAMQSMTNNYGFNVYKDNNNYVEMFQRSSEWGLKGVVNGTLVFQLGGILDNGEWKDNNIIAGWKIKTTGFEGGNFKYPTISGSAPNYSVSGGQGSKLFPDGGIMLIPTGTGILVPSSGLMQAGLIKVEGDNSMLVGLEIIAHGNGYLKEITSLKLSARNDYSTPSKRPSALEIASGDVNIGIGNFMTMKGQLHFDNVISSSASVITLTKDSGHFIHLNPASGNPVVSVSSGLPLGSWFVIAQTSSAGGYYYMKLQGSERFMRRGNSYQQVNAHNQDPSFIFKLTSTVWVIGNLPVNWIDWN